jgi:predicted  nucleic acid-binding Zn-ribbon protein
MQFTFEDVPMSQTTIEKELKLIRQRLEAIEEALAEEMTASDKRDLKEALAEHKRGKSIPFERVRNRH